MVIVEWCCQKNNENIAQIITFWIMIFVENYSYRLGFYCFQCQNIFLLCLPLQLPLKVVNVHTPHRNAPPLSPGAHVVSVDEEQVNFDTGGKKKTMSIFLSLKLISKLYPKEVHRAVKSICGTSLNRLDTLSNSFPSYFIVCSFHA